MKSFLLIALFGYTIASPLSSSSCSEDCIQYVINDPSGPKILRLYKELLKTDTQSTTIDVNGQTYPVSYTKKNLIDNAIRKGVRESVIESMLDDAAIFPTRSFSPSSRTPQTQQTVESPTERRPGNLEPLTSTTSYRIFTKTNGDVNIDVKGQTLRVPDDLPRLTTIVKDTDTLQDIIRQLQELGVPVKREGTRVVVGNTESPKGLTLRVSIKKIDDKPSSVTITANDQKYTLPGDEYSLNRYLAREPEVAYHILRILSTHGVPVEYDSKTKTIKTTLTSERDLINSRTTIGSSNTPSTSSGHTHPSAANPKVLRIGSSSYYLPEDWDRLRRDVEDKRVSARDLLDQLDQERIAAPSDIITTIRTRISTSASKVRVMRYGDEITIEMGNEKFKLPQDARGLEIALKENDFPLELIRDSLLRIGIDSRRIGSSLRVSIPGGDAYLSGLPTTKQYDYKVVSQSHGVEVTAGSEVYNLPSDQSRLESAIAEKKVLPRTLVDAFNDVGISSKMDIEKQEMTIELPTRTLRISVPLSVQSQKVGSRLRLKVRGPEGSKVYTLTVGESGTDQIELPAEVSILNSYIRSGKVDSGLLLQLLTRMGVTHYPDTAHNKNVVTINGKQYDIDISSRQSTGGFITEDCSACSPDNGSSSHRQETVY